MNTSTTHRFLPLLAAGALAFASQAGAAEVLHLRGDLGVTQSGGDVTAWADQSSNGQDVFVGTHPARPTVSTALNGLDTIRFNSSEQDLLIRNGDITTPSASGLPGLADDFHGFAVVRPTGNQAPAWGNILAWGPQQAVSKSMVFVGISSGAAGLEPYISGEYNIGALEEGTSLSIGTAYIIEFYGDGDGISSSTYGIGLNGEAFAGFTTVAYTGLNNAAPVDLGVGHHPGSSIFLDGDIAEIRLFNSLLTETERQNIGASLEATWGIDGGYTAIPEPSSLMLIGLAGLAGLAFARRRR